MEPYGWDGHLLLVHNGEQQRRAGLAAWVRRGLELGAKILYFEPVDEPAGRTLMGVLRDHEIRADAAVGRGQLQVLPANGEAYTQASMASFVDEALAAGYPTVRWSAEAETAWSVMSRTAHADLEWSTDELCHTRPVSILCQYPAALSQATLQAVCAMHRAGVRESLLHTSPVPGGIALAGEVDVSNEAILRSSLLAACCGTQTDRGTFVVDLSRLDFLDVAGAKALVSATSAHRMTGGKVLLRAAQPSVYQLLRLLGIERAHGFVFKGPR